SRSPYGVEQISGFNPVSSNQSVDLLVRCGYGRCHSNPANVPDACDNNGVRWQEPGLIGTPLTKAAARQGH
ncbi:uncharacterized protein METZ01_LOCUS496812, partial [marine metagenome]